MSRSLLESFAATDLYATVATNTFGLEVGVSALRRGGEVRLVSKEVNRLTNLRLRRFAAKHPPAQSWYDEDMTGLY